MRATLTTAFIRILISFGFLASTVVMPTAQAKPALALAQPVTTSTLTPTPAPTSSPTSVASNTPAEAGTSIATDVWTSEPPPTATQLQGYPMPEDTLAPTLDFSPTPTGTDTETPTPTATIAPSATLPVNVPITAVIASTGGQLTFDALTLDFPASAVDTSAKVSVAPLDKLPAELPLDVWYKDYGVEVEIKSVADDTKIDHTTLPVTITLQYAKLVPDLSEASQRLLTLYHYDETQGTWERLLTDVSPSTGVLTATLSSFSPVVLTSGTQTSVGDYAKPWQPKVMDYSVDNFTGSVAWRIPIEVPKGRGNLAPDLALVYSSAAVDELRGNANPQTPGIGMGWSLGGVAYIERKIVRDGAGTPIVKLDGTDKFSIVLNGVSSELVCVDTSVTPCVEYRTKDERFWRIRKLTGAPNESQRTGQNALKGEYWLVTINGVNYRFGWSGEDHPELYPNQTDAKELSAWHLYGKEDPTTAIVPYIWRWNLDRIEDPHHNVVSLYYTREYNDYYICNGNNPLTQCWYFVDGLWNVNALPSFNIQTPDGYWWAVQNSTSLNGWNWGYTRGGYLRQVTYTRGNGLPAPYSVVVNVQQDSEFYPNSLDSYQGSNGRWPQKVQTFWSKNILKSIAVQANGQLIRRYNLNNSGGAGLLLNSVQVTGSDGTSVLPATQFGYLQYPSYRSGQCSGGTDGDWSKRWLDNVNNGYGGTVTFIYTGPLVSSPKFISQNGQTCDPDTDPNNNNVHWLRYRIRQITANPGVGSSQITVYEYRNAANTGADGGSWFNPYSTDPNAPPREFRGHPVGRVFRIDQGAGSDPAIAYQDLYFHQGLGATISGVCGGNVTDSNGMQGRQYKSVSYDQVSAALASKVTRYKFTDFGAGRYFIAPKAECDYSQPGSNTNSRRTEYDYDNGGTPNYGNITAKREYTAADATSPYRTTLTQYAINSTTAWITNKPWRVQAFAGDATGAETSHIEYCYDRDVQGNPLCNGAAPQLGNVTKQDITELISGTHAIAQNWYDAYGNLTITQDPLSHPITTTYDSTYQQFPIQVCNVLNQCSTTEYYGVNGAPLDNGFFGQMRRKWDSNGQTTAAQYLYDPFGRLVKVAQPGDTPTTPTIQYNYFDGSTPFKIETWQRTVSGCGSCIQPVFQFYDGLAQLIQTRSPMGDGTIQSVTNIVYDPLGRKQKEYIAAQEVYTTTFSRPTGWDTRPNTVTQYDALGRITRLTNPDGTATKTSYSSWQTAVLDANGHQRISNSDGFGRVTTVKEYTQTLTTADFNLPSYSTTQYVYDTLDRLTRVTNALGNTTVITYNTLGQKIGMLDVDMGQWSYTYDQASNLKTQTDAKGQTLWFKYDAINRLTEKRMTSSTGQLLATFTYDIGQYGIGHRTGITDTSGSTSWAYDARGRNTMVSQVITSTGTYTTTYEYDAADRVRAIIYPNGEVVGQSYDAASQLRSVCGGLDVTCSTSYAFSMTYNALGQIKQMALGNGATTTYDYYGDGGPATNSFRLWQIKTTQGANTLFNFQYRYDPIGNVTTITDTLNANQVQTLGYDHLDRLLSASTTAVGSGQYSETYQYDPTGNLTSKAGTVYGYQDAAHKHAVTHLAGVQKLWYNDANGNMTKRIEGGATYTQTFDVENRLISVTSSISGTTQFVYDGEGNRVLQILPNGDKIAYIGNLMEVIIPAVIPPQPTPTPTPTPTPVPTPLGLAYKLYIPLLIGPEGEPPLPPTNPVPIPWGQTWKTYYYANNRLIAQRVASNPNATSDGLFYITTDHLGSLSLVMDNAGNVLARQSYYPYGQIRSTTGAMPTSRGYNGHIADISTGLLFYNARYYSQLGRFISPDTIVPSAGNPQALNRYAHTLNNPLKYTDPSGHCPVPAADTGRVICIDLFIQTRKIIGGTALGNDRSFSSNSLPDQSKGYIYLYLDENGMVTGSAMGVSSSCLSNGKCFGPYPEYNSHTWYQDPKTGAITVEWKLLNGVSGAIQKANDIASGYTKSNDLAEKIVGRAAKLVTGSASAVDHITGLANTIDGWVTLGLNAQGAYEMRSLYRDKYPSMGIYYYEGGQLGYVIPNSERGEEPAGWPNFGLAPWYPKDIYP